jgi:excisionase family DNA binding protein
MNEKEACPAPKVYGRRADDALQPLLYRVRDAAHLMGVTEQHLRDLIVEGAIPVRRLGRRVLVPAAWIRSFVADQDARDRLTDI